MSSIIWENNNVDDSDGSIIERAMMDFWPHSSKFGGESGGKKVEKECNNTVPDIGSPILVMTFHDTFASSILDS